MTELPVDVIIPCHNYGRFVEEAVVSVMEQTMAARRVVVINDGSSDESAAVLDALAERFPIEVVHQANAGLVNTLRRGIAMTDSEFFVTVSADDRLHPRFLELTYAALQGDERAGYCYAQMEYIGDRSGLVDIRPFDARTMVCAGNIVGGVALVRRRAYDETCGFADLPALEDWDLWLQFLECGYRGVDVATPLYYWRQHGPQRNKLAARDERRLRRRIQRRHPRLLLRYYPGYLPTALRNLWRRFRD